MHRSALVRTAVAGAAAVGLLVGLWTPSVAAAATSKPKTKITFVVTGCDGCTMSANQYDRSTQSTFSSTSAKVTAGRVVFTVPTARTRGMYFAINTTPPAQIDAQPLVTTQVAGHAPGSVVTRAQQIATRRASACWAGTNRSAVTIRVTVDRVRMTSFPDASHKTLVPLARFAPTVDALGGFQRAYRGVLATQDVWLCAN